MNPIDDVLSMDSGAQADLAAALPNLPLLMQVAVEAGRLRATMAGNGATYFAGRQLDAALSDFADAFSTQRSLRQPLLDRPGDPTR